MCVRMNRQHVLHAALCKLPRMPDATRCGGVAAAQVSLDLVPFVAGLKGPAECLMFERSTPLRIHIVPRRRAPRPLRMPLRIHIIHQAARAHFLCEEGSVSHTVSHVHACKAVIAAEKRAPFFAGEPAPCAP